MAGLGLGGEVAGSEPEVARDLGPGRVAGHGAQGVVPALPGGRAGVVAAPLPEPSAIKPCAATG